MIGAKTSLKAILALGVAGMIFSGYLTWLELYGTQGPTCPALGASGTIFGAPPCVYGLVMYAAVTALAGMGLWGRE